MVEGCVCKIINNTIAVFVNCSYNYDGFVVKNYGWENGIDS